MDFNMKNYLLILFILIFGLKSNGQSQVGMFLGTGKVSGGGSHIIAWSVEITQSQCGSASSDTITIPVYIKSDSLKHISLGGYVADWEGDDILFYLSDTTSLMNWYNVRYRPDSGIIEAWVKIYNTGSNFKMCLGSRTRTTFQGGSATDVWKSTVVAAYPMNDSNGSNLTDISGHGYNATQSNTPVRVIGTVGFAEHIAGASSQQYSYNITEIDNATKFSFLFWGKRDASSNTIVHGKRSASAGVSCFMYSDGFYYFQFQSGYGSVSIPGASWNYVAMVFDGAGATNSDRCRIWDNGVEQILSISGTIPTSISPPTGDFIIGKDGSAFPDRQTGSTDNLILYRSAVSQDWIITTYNSQLNLPNLGNSGTPFLRFIRI